VGLGSVVASWGDGRAPRALATYGRNRAAGSVMVSGGGDLAACGKVTRLDATVPALGLWALRLLLGQRRSDGAGYNVEGGLWVGGCSFGCWVMIGADLF
jgi:hypothetical protein